LSLEEREEISRGLAEGVSLREIAERLGRAPSTTSSEVERNGGGGRYRAMSSTRFVMLMKLENATADEVLRAMTKKIKTLPRELRRSVTWDQGNEMARQSRVHDRDRRAGLLLQPLEPLAERLQRADQRTPPPVLPEGH
jgi:IS30 family transposase